MHGGKSWIHKHKTQRCSVQNTLIWSGMTTSLRWPTLANVSKLKIDIAVWWILQSQIVYFLQPFSICAAVTYVLAFITFKRLHSLALKCALDPFQNDSLTNSSLFTVSVINPFVLLHCFSGFFWLKQIKLFSHSSLQSVVHHPTRTSLMWHYNNCPRGIEDFSWHVSNTQREAVLLLWVAITHSQHGRCNHITFSQHPLCLSRQVMPQRERDLNRKTLNTACECSSNFLMSLFTPDYLFGKKTQDGPPCCALNWVFYWAFLFILL